jgi:hypothetical protein
MSIPTNSEILKRFTNELRIAPRDANPKRKRGFRQRSPRLRFGLVCPVGYPSENRSCSPGLARLTITGRMVITPRIRAEDRHTRAGSALCALRRNSGRELARSSKSSPAEPLTRCSVASHLASRGYLGSRISRHFSKAPMTLIKDRIEIPDRVSKDQYVLHLSEGVTRPDESLPFPVLPGYRPMHCLEGLLSGGRTANRTRVYIHTLASPAARAFRVPGRLEPGCGFDPNFSGDRRPRRTD